MILERFAPRFNEIIIDTEGGGTATTALGACDACLVVASPQWETLDSDEQLLDSVRGINPTLVAHLIFNRCYVGFDETECEVDRSAAAWEDGSIFTLSNLKSFAESCGLAVTELTSEDCVAIKETTTLFEHLYGKFEPKPKIEKLIRQGFFSLSTHAYATELPAMFPPTQAGRTDVQ